MASVGSILAGGFRLYQEQPVIVAIWAVLHIAYAVGLVAIASAGIVTDFGAPGVGAASPLEALGMALLFGLISLFAMSVINCAIYRAILRPDEGGFAWLRVGSDEFRMFGLYLILIAIGIIIGLVVVLLMMAVMAALGMARGVGGSFGILFVAIIAVIGIYLSVRLAMISPTTFLRRRIAIDEGWGLSSGRFWTLFLALLVIWVIVMALQMLAPTVPGQPGLLDTIRAMSAAGSLEALQDQPAVVADTLSFAAMLPYVLIAALVQAFSTVTYGAAAATAVREFLRDDGEVLDDDIQATAQVFE